MTKTKKSLLAVAFVIWVLGAIFLARKTFDYYYTRSDQQQSEDALTLERLIFPSRMTRDQD
jgi:hypothetical protein